MLGKIGWLGMFVLLLASIVTIVFVAFTSRNWMRRIPIGSLIPRTDSRIEVVKDGEGSTLIVGGVNHGRQSGRLDREPVEPEEVLQRRLPGSYFHWNGPLGLATRRVTWFGVCDKYPASDARMPASILGSLAPSSSPLLPMSALATLWSEPPMAQVLMHTGATAAYARPFQHFDFYESNKELIELTQPREERPKFMFVADAKERGALVRIVPGNERESLRVGPKSFYHTVFIDLYRGTQDSLVDELLTREAMSDISSSMTPDGIACFHVSSRKHDLFPILATTANQLGLSAVSVVDGGSTKGNHFSSIWVFVFRNPATTELLRKSLIDITAANGDPLKVTPRMRAGPLLDFNGPVWSDAGPRNQAAIQRR